MDCGRSRTPFVYNVTSGGGTGGAWGHAAASPRITSTDCRGVEATLADDDETAVLLLASAPGAVIIALDPAADGLHDLPHRLARNGEETLDAKNIETERSFAQARLDLGRVGDRRHADHKALEVVVSVFLAVIVMGRAV